MRVWQFLNARSRMLLLLVGVLPAVNIAALMVTENPSLRWQQFSGTSVLIGSLRQEEKQAQLFLERVRQDGKDVTLYSFDVGIPNMIFYGLGYYDKEIIKSNFAHYVNINPYDWLSGFVIRA